MLPVLFYVGVTPVILGRLLLPPAKQIHDKVLYANADMLKANWLSAAAAVVGVLGIAIGWWWVDAVAALTISLSITRDGLHNTRTVVGDLMGRKPEVTTDTEYDPLPEHVETMLQNLDWVDHAEVRMRENGHVLFGEAFVIPATQDNLPQRIEQAVQQAYNLDWRLQDLVIHLVPSAGRRTDTPESRSGR